MATDRPQRVALDLRGMTGVEELFRLSGGVRSDPAVDAWLSGEPAELRAIAAQWFAYVRQLGGDVRELLHDDCPVACVEDAAFAYVNAFRSHVNVGFHHGASLEDPAGLLQGSGRRMRHVKLTPGIPIDAAALRKLIDTAYADIRARLLAG